MRLRLILLLSCWFCVLQAQPPRHFRHFTEKDGLSDNRVQAILRDRDGFLWVGTANGLNVYDGYTFRHFLPDPSHLGRSVSSESINDLLQDNAGNIWIATNNGLNRYDAQTHRFDAWTNIGRNDGSLPNPIVWDLATDAKGRLWLACDNRDLCRYDPATDRFVTYPWRAFVHQVLPDLAPETYTVIYEISRKSSHAFWLSTNKGVFSFDWLDAQFAYHPFPATFAHASGISKCPQSTLFGTWDQDILQYDPCLQTWRQILLPLPKDLVGGRRLVSAVLPYHDGYCILTRQGLYWMAEQTQQVTTLPQQGDEAMTMPSGLLTDAYLDSDGALWIGGEQGLWLSEPLHQQIQYQVIKPSSNADFYNTFCRFLDVPHVGRLCLDFYYHELYLLQDGKPVQTWMLPPKANLLHRDRQGTIWVGGGNEIFQLDLATMRLQPMAMPSRQYWQGQQGRYFSDIAEDSEGNRWFGHFANGILVWKSATQSWWVPDAQDGFIAKQVTSLLHDPSHATIWIGTEDYGLYRYDERSGRFTLYQHDPNNVQHSLGAYIVNGLALDSAGYLWAATDPGGISRFDYAAPVGQEFLTVGASAGLPSNRATSIICDPKGRIWVGTTGGIACLDMQHKRVRAFTKDDGLVVDFADQPLVMAADGHILNGTMYGYQFFDPDSILQEHMQEGINLTTFKIFDEALDDSLHLSTTPLLKLHYSQNFFSFEFASSDVASSRKTVYAYRLQGFDPAWIVTGHRHHGSYTNVPPGNYTLEIRSGQEGRWNAPGFRLQISITPPYWATWWFRTLVILTFGGLIYSLYRLRIRQVRKEEALKSEFNQRIAKTEMTALRAQMNPHFVFNCLSSINRFIMVNQPEEASAYLTKFSRLIRLILDNSRTETVVLSKELEALKLYIEMEQMRFADRFEYRLDVDKALQIEHLEIPPLLIQPYVENAIWHGLMHKKEACLLTIRVYTEENRLCIEVEDNGVGRAKALELRSRSAMLQKSHGMKVTSERLEVINRLYGTHATVDTIDLIDAAGAAIGTRIKLCL